MHAQNDSTSNSVHSITAVITIVLALTHCAINVLQYGLCYYVQSHTVQSMCYSMVYVIMCNHTLCNQCVIVWSMLLCAITLCSQCVIVWSMLLCAITHCAINVLQYGLCYYVQSHTVQSMIPRTIIDPYNNTKDDD